MLSTTLSKQLLLYAAVTAVFLGLLLCFFWRMRKTDRVPGFWVLSNLSTGAGFLLVYLRDQIPDFFSILVGNVLILLGLVLMHAGVRVFFDKRPRWLEGGLVLGGYTACQLVFTFVIPNFSARVVLIAVAGFFFALRISLGLMQDPPPNLRALCRGLAVYFILVALLSLARLGVLFQIPAPTNLASDDLLTLVLLAATLSMILWNFYFFFLVSARLEIGLIKSQEDLLALAAGRQQKVVQLGLLDEISRSIAESMDETEIMRRTVRAIINSFGYAEAAISLLVEEKYLEIAAIDGTEDVGYRPGFRQVLGEGIIGRAAEKQEIYISQDIENDPYYFTIGQRSGSAVCIPMNGPDRLLGVLYVESVRKNAFSPDEVQTLDTLVRHAATAVQKARLFARVESQLQTLSVIQAVSHTILSSLDLRAIFQMVVQEMKDTFHYTHVSIYTLHDQMLRLEAQAGYPEDQIFWEIPVGSGVTGRCVQTRSVQFLRNVSADPAFLRAEAGVESEICVPILKGDQALGFLNVEADKDHPLTEDDTAILSVLAAPVAIAIENARLHGRVRDLAMTDGLTGLFNRRAFDEILDTELKAAQRYNHPLSLAIIDMDSFKQFNDLFGHLAGDDRLREVAELLRASLRGADIVARYGGEEFGVILPYTTLESACVMAERLRAQAETCAPARSESLPGGAGPIPGYTISVGVASYPRDGDKARDLLFAADQAEMRAKRLGKNCVCTAGQDG